MLLCQFGNAVVDIQAEWILLGLYNSLPSGATGTIKDLSPSLVAGWAVGDTRPGIFTDPQGVTGDFQATRLDYVVKSNGFFIKGHYIVAPASTLLLPPTYSPNVIRWPLTAGPDAQTLGLYKDAMVRPSRILVTVRNVNNKSHSFVYEADLVGVDGAGDLAVLRIDERKQFNACNPCVEKCHPYLTFGKSRAQLDGESVLLLGTNESANRITEGTLQNHRYADYSGYAVQELVLVSAPNHALAVGAPIINRRGEVIGMQTITLDGLLSTQNVCNSTIYGDASARMIAGPSQKFMQHVIGKLIMDNCDRRCREDVEIINDPVGCYNRYIKGYLGMAYEVLTGSDYDVNRHHEEGDSPATYAGRPLIQIRLDANGRFLNSPGCKEIVGVRVVGLAGANPDDVIRTNPNTPSLNYFVPGGATTVFKNLALPNSPLLGIFEAGDVITSIANRGGRDCVQLGDLDKQIVPALATWMIKPGDRLSLSWRRGGNYLLTGPAPGGGENYDSLYHNDVTAIDFPKFMDYPYYAASSFPNLLGASFPNSFGATFPTPLNAILSFTGIANQAQSYYPGVADSAPFHPAI